mmetsp:Transcript_37854/g.50273  ORF Transcript_37854/g.50273 Transcript_37854/m.50273 type:complete len:85 (-) Transcript_37854:435-689(-)
MEKFTHSQLHSHKKYQFIQKTHVHIEIKYNPIHANTFIVLLRGNVARSLCLFNETVNIPNTPRQEVNLSKRVVGAVDDAVIIVG